MNYFYKLYLLVPLLTLISCSKEKAPQNYNLLGMPEEKIKEITIGYFEVVSVAGGITGYPSYPKNQYVRITADSINWYDGNTKQFVLAYTWGAISLYGVERYGLTPHYVPDRVENGNLILVQPTGEITGYELKRM
ncbi:hypothetical protein DBR11_04960 [Pedobacter sp. HMWF019]|uniref:hypothetical protein n=1 Tax=Pedobacter sp. HMWF019 TaxID=2056856 RepID=UPI000D3587BC|nr:hypothetical protein [Pedobacter sp. HMWF019]PTT02340.1 hypothetical protein DBR11_04960 [Pedobacter sp. HMWF019]